jgi:hypothetical protein
MIVLRRSFWMLALALAAFPASAGDGGDGRIDLALAARYFAEAEASFARDGGALWERSLAGPMMFVDPETRQAVTNMPDAEGRLREVGGVHVATLPDTWPVSDTSIEWAGVRWAMMRWPLAEDEHERAALMAHESWHRIQEEIGFPGSGAVLCVTASRHIRDEYSPPGAGWWPRPSAQERGDLSPACITKCRDLTA